MKELSIEEKAKRYDEAIERAKDFMNGEVHYELKIGENIMYWVFPELKESEDEKIRKWIKKELEPKYVVDNIVNNVMADKAFAWLEKQGENSVRWNENTDDKKPQKKHSVLMKTAHGVAEGEWNGDDSWIQYRWSCSIKDSDVLFWTELSDLEEQGEQILANSEKTCKDEPKFKVGDWVVVNDGRTGRIIKCTKDFANVDLEFSRLLARVNNIRSWTIQDAKDGDVLASKDKLSILIFRNFDSSTSFSSYYNIEGRGEKGWSNGCFIPAAKEQRDLLFQKMKEAGYEWDEENKKLKKVEQNPAWSEDDMNMIRLLVAIFEVNYPDGFYKVNPIGTTNMQGIHSSEIIKWLKNLKERVQPQPKQKWSDEDYNEIETIACHLDNIGNEGMGKDIMQYTR